MYGMINLVETINASRLRSAPRHALKSNFIISVRRAGGGAPAGLFRTGCVKRFSHWVTRRRFLDVGVKI